MNNTYQRPVTDKKRHAMERFNVTGCCFCAVMEQKQPQHELQMAHQQRSADRPVDDVQQGRV